MKVALQSQTIQRVFVYGGAKLADPDNGMTPQQVMAFWSAHYGELNNAVVEGPAVSGAVHTYTFIKAVRDKG